jgi:nitric oxide reductase NorD protein
VHDDRPRKTARETELAQLGMLASALAHRPLQVSPGAPGEPAWTDGEVVFVDAQQGREEQLRAIAVQASLLSAGSLRAELVAELVRRPALARRYLVVEGQRALSAAAPLLPPSLLPTFVTPLRPSASAAASLELARSHQPLPEPPPSFGAIHARQLLARRAEAPAVAAGSAKPKTLVELAEDASSDAPAQDSFVGALGGGGALGKWLSKLLTAARQLTGGGSPGADAPTHWTRSGRRGPRAALMSTASTGAVEDTRVQDGGGTKYPEWDVHAQRYRMDWCTVSELELPARPEAARFAIADRTALRRALTRLGLGIDRYHRQPQGDDIDIDAVIESRIELLAGSAPDEDVFIHSVRRRRDLSVLILLDVSGSAGEPGEAGKTVHEQQRSAAAALTLALHELGDRVALYAYHSQGRASVRLMPVKRFADDTGPRFLQKLGGLEPGAYSRLGAAIRHGTAMLQDFGGTRRQLLVVLSDGLAYDHGYEPHYGAADAQRALGEARSQGVACLCLSIGARTDPASLRKVFGALAHAALPTPEQLAQVIGPLFRSAIKSADVRRRIA